MTNIFVNYDAKTKKIIEAYGEEENTPEPYIAVSIEDWSDINKYGIDNIYVSDDLTSLIVSDEVKAKADIPLKISIIDQQILAMEATQPRQIREITLGLDTDGTAQAKLTASNDKITALRTERATLSNQLN